ncbi:MAG: NYN domain-containing protein [Eubacterium sp.]|nr:NYN domain-containing protein [Eubacterium sp.]
MVKKVRKPNNEKQNTGLLIDGENVGAKKVNAILNAARSQGKLYEGKVYGRQKDIHTRQWSDKAKEYGISDIRLYGGPEKNKVDNKIKKDARRLINQHKNIDIVCIATSDNGYVDIIRELRSLGKRVVVIGEKQASASLRSSCNCFVEI